MCYSAPTTVHYRHVAILLLEIFTREEFERIIQVTYMTSTRLVENYHINKVLLRVLESAFILE